MVSDLPLPVRTSSTSPHNISPPTRSDGDWFPERNLFQFFIAITSGTCSKRSTILVLISSTRTTLFACFLTILPPSLCYLISSNDCFLLWHCTNTFMRRLVLRHVHRQPRYPRHHDDSL